MGLHLRRDHHGHRAGPGGDRLPGEDEVCQVLQFAGVDEYGLAQRQGLVRAFAQNWLQFEEAARKQRFQEAEKEARKRKREIAQAEKRIAELDRIFKRIYEDDISGAISHERFLKLSADYEAEQKELTEQVKVWRDAVETFEQDQADFASFAAIVRKYVGIRELTPTIVNEFVKKIIVHAPDKSSGHRRQKIELVWNFIGEVNLPGDDQTVERQRKGRTA